MLALARIVTCEFSSFALRASASVAEAWAWASYSARRAEPDVNAEIDAEPAQMEEDN